MAEPIILKLLPAERGWKVTRNDRLVAHYPTYNIALAEMARIGRREAKKGNTAKAIMHRGNGEVAGERSYTPRSTPSLRA